MMMASVERFGLSSVNGKVTVSAQCGRHLRQQVYQGIEYLQGDINFATSVRPW